MTWGPLPQITAFERNPSVDEKETRTLDCSGGKCHSKLTRALTNHLMTVLQHAVAGNAYNEPREDVGEEEEGRSGWRLLIACHLSASGLKN